ncbi:hypothetical protein [Clostridium estertheticum]|uniref:hypothetical protein n=1 Tax=Clostridium estertheticum TaxID=238834 RepID=UPI001C0D8622|nr:hypothetical protein [Clostridium estertheticum]MBU3186531.1 hypothetical protein [Clostridium estertheticum]
MAKLSKKRCKMCGTKIDPDELVTRQGENFCSKSCITWYVSTYLSDEDDKEEKGNNIGNI